MVHAVPLASLKVTVPEGLPSVLLMLLTVVERVTVSPGSIGEDDTVTVTAVSTVGANVNLVEAAGA